MTLTSWMSALTGFLVCAFITAATYAWLYLAAPSLADAHSRELIVMLGATEAEARSWLLHDARSVARNLAVFLLSASAIYWFFSALLGRGAVASIRSANLLLILAAACLLGTALNQYYGWAETFCDQLPFPHQGFQITKIDKCPSSATFFSALQLISALLLLASLTVRIFSSRRTAKATYLPSAPDLTPRR